MSLLRQLSDTEVRTLRKLAGLGLALHEIGKEMGLRSAEVEDAIKNHGVVRSQPAANGEKPFVHRKLDWRIVEKLTPGKLTGFRVSFAKSTGVMMVAPAPVRALGNPSHVVLMWAEKERVLGLRAAQPEEHGARAFKTPAVQLRAFLREEGMEISGRYDARMDGDVLVIDLASVPKPVPS